MSDHNEEKKEEFQSWQVIMTKIMKVGFVNYAQTLLGLKDAFELEKHKPNEDFGNCLCCMDERTPYGLHSAGSGILLSDEEFERYFSEADVKSISSHDNCGAGKIYCQKFGLSAEDSDGIVREWAERKSKEKNIPHIHLPVSKPFHCARVCYYDGTGLFNYQGVEGLPPGFVIGRKYMTEEASLKEANIAAKIILGDHGFGQSLLTQENPFFFVAIGKTSREMEGLKEELSRVENFFGDRTKIDGFVAPAQ